MESRIGSGRSPQNAKLTSMTKRAGRLPKPARAPNPPAANTALSRSVRNLFQIGSLIAVAPCWRSQYGLFRPADVAVDVVGLVRQAGAVAADDRLQRLLEAAGFRLCGRRPPPP